MRIAKEALTFDDVLLQPGYSDVLPREVDLSTRLTREIRLSIPLLSAAMDTVTESRLAIALAQEGGSASFTRTWPSRSRRDQVLMVKKFESGMVRNPITVSLGHEHSRGHRTDPSLGISGCAGRRCKTYRWHRDAPRLRFETQLDAPVSTVMTPQDRLVTVRDGADVSRSDCVAAQAPY